MGAAIAASWSSPRSSESSRSLPFRNTRPHRGGSLHPSDPRSTPPSRSPAPESEPGTGAAAAAHSTRPSRAPKGTRDSKAAETLPGFHRGMDNLETIKVKAQARQKLDERVADFFTRFSGSMIFVYLHAIWFGVWIPWNLGWIGLKPFDPFPFGLLTMVVS